MADLQSVYIGDPTNPDFTFDGDAITGVSMETSVNLIGEELYTDSIQIEVTYDDEDEALRALAWATPIFFYMGERLEGKFYSTKVVRTGRRAYRIEGASAAGILDYETFYGGIYTGTAFKTLVERIIGTNGLQPYNGVYPRIQRVVKSSGSVINPLYMGTYRDQALSSQSDLGNAYLSATMSSKLHAKIKLNGYLQTVADSGYTSARCHLLGATAVASASAAVKKHQYGMYMQMTRASTSVHYADFGEVFFCFGQTEISLGTPTAPITYEIDVDPGAGKAVINGTTYTISIPSGVANDPCPLHAYGGGVRLTTVNSAVAHDHVGHTCQMEMFEYVISSAADALLSSYVEVRNAFTEYCSCFDLITKKIGKATNGNLNVYDEDLIPYDDEEYGDFPLFVNQTAFQADVLAGLAYANGVDTLPVYGWLPVYTKREALHQLLLAMGVIIEKNDDGNILFTIVTGNTAGEVDSDAVYNEGSEEQLEHTNFIELTEHAFSYDSSAETEIIFESTTGSSGDYYIALYDSAPVYGTPTASGLTRHYSNCNAAVVSGIGTLSAKRYKHEETVLRRTLANYPDGRTVSVKDATLVTLQNSERVMDRLVAYYGGSVYKVNVGIVQNGERCGLKYSLLSAFGEAISGFLVRASKVATSIIKAACQVIVGYVPPAYDAGYSNYVILTGEGTWDVPAEVFEKQTPRIRVVLIGGGQGGTSGYAGATGETPARGAGSTAAEGGAAGAAGQGGKVYEVTITNPAASYYYSCGEGGEGGAISESHDTANLGSSGGDTEFSDGTTTYSSGAGAVKDNGITNLFTGQKYAYHVDMDYHAQSMHGGAGGYHVVSDAGLQYMPASYSSRRFRPTATYHGGSEGAGYYSGGYIFAAGGAGGGAGFGSDGGDGMQAGKTSGIYRGGAGGKGGNATGIPPDPLTENPRQFGYGGYGGGGGGGGGAGGWATPYDNSTSGAGRAGGYGGEGGPGAAGCVLIYY